MADKNSRHARRGDIGENELPLCSFSGIEQESFIIPSQKISALIAETGRLLARAPQNNQVAGAHVAALWAKKEHRPKKAPIKAPTIWAVLAMLGAKATL